MQVVLCQRLSLCTVIGGKDQVNFAVQVGRRDGRRARGCCEAAVICTALPARGDGGIRQKLKDAATLARANHCRAEFEVLKWGQVETWNCFPTPVCVLGNNKRII
jgi:hypothetical protein